jgi:membrane protein
MAFFAVLTLVPSTVAVGSALGLLEWLIGADAVTGVQDSAIRAVRALMGPELADTVVSPFVRAQLSQPQGGLALGGLLLAWWLASHLFASTAHALDAVYGVTDRRTTLTQRFIALCFALGSVVVVALTAEMMVVGPLGDPSGGVARELGLGEAYTVTWSVVRWPFLLLVIVAFLVLLYRFSPNVTHSWRQCVPGAALGATLWIVAAAGFRLASDVGIRFATGVAAEDPKVTIIGESVSAVVATALWAYLASVAILLGGEFNAMLSARRGRPPAGAADP